VSAHDPDRDLDDLLRDDAGRFGSLYRKLPRYEPPRRLDRTVLGEAARSVRSGKPPRRQRWLVGVGSAAGLVLAAGIAWRIGHDPMNEGAMPPESAPTVVPVQPIDGSAHAKREQSAQPEAATADALSSPAPATQNAAPTRPGERDAIKQDARKVRTAAKLAAPAPKPAEASAPEPFPAAPRQREELQSKDLEKSQSFEASQPAIGGATGAAAGAAAGAVAPAMDKNAAASERARMPASPTVPSGSVELRRDMQLPPGEWLSHIRELERQGRHQQAMESLRLFIRVHPERKVPVDLQPLLD